MTMAITVNANSTVYTEAEVTEVVFCVFVQCDSQVVTWHTKDFWKFGTTESGELFATKTSATPKQKFFAIFWVSGK